jgi:hypothetical protein
VVAAGAGLALAPCAHHVACAVLIRAEERAATVHALPFGRFGRIERRVRAFGVTSDIAQLGKVGEVIGPVRIDASVKQESIAKTVMERVRNKPVRSYPNCGF